MSISPVQFDGVAKSAGGPPAPGARAAKGSPDAAVLTACEAARAAMSAFDEAARRGEGFGALCELSQSERSAVSAVCGARSSTPLGVAEKALLLDCFLSEARRSEVTKETVDFALSLANDAVAIARALAAARSTRFARNTASS